MTVRARVTAGLLAQILGQVLTACAIVAHLADWTQASVWVAVPLAAAVAVPFRHDGTLHDRAVGNFGAASVVAGFSAWELVIGGVDGILGGGLPPAGASFILLTLASAVLFAGAGAAFWLLREDRPGR